MQRCRVSRVSEKMPSVPTMSDFWGHSAPITLDDIILVNHGLFPQSQKVGTRQKMQINVSLIINV